MAPSDDLSRFLPEELVGRVLAVAPISMGQSGSAVYAVTTTLGELVLRVQPERVDPTLWTQQLRVLRRAAEAGVAPAILHVDETARAIVSRKIAGAPIAAALGDPAQRGAVIGGVVAQLRVLHALDASDVVAPRDPIAYGRSVYAAQRQRAGYPAWAGAIDPLFDELAAVLSRDPRRVVSHNDLNPGNVLWDGARAWLVDWEVAALNHPFYDLAALAMFLQLDADVAAALLAAQEGRPVDDAERATFAGLRRLVALICGLTFLSLVPDLAVLPSPSPTLAEFYAGLRAGRIDLGTPNGRAAFGLALLRLGVG